jgi:N-acetylglucosamine transport system permease protein
VQTAFIYIGILALDAFVYMAALEPGGGPDNTTLVMAQQLFTTAFAKGQFGYACAMGVVLGRHHTGVRGSGVRRESDFRWQE